MNVLFAPHNDDETLFAAYTVMRHECMVVVCLRSRLQEERGGPKWIKREAETLQALVQLGVPTFRQWEIGDDIAEHVMEGHLRGEMVALSKRIEVERVWAPAMEPGGHWQHNLVGAMAEEVFGPERTSFYLTYVRGEGRSRGREVVPTPEMMVAKLNALACYRSQIEVENTRPWFMDDVMREWVPE